jgi:hypothetical protein
VIKVETQVCSIPFIQKKRAHRDNDDDDDDEMQATNMMSK